MPEAVPFDQDGVLIDSDGAWDAARRAVVAEHGGHPKDEARRAVMGMSAPEARGKPAPDIYLEAARRLGVDAGRSAAVEDSTNGLRSAAAAGMLVLALPNHEFRPERDALALAAVLLDSLDQLSPALFERPDVE